MNTADFDYVCEYVHDQAAIVLEPAKKYLVEWRLQTLARKEKIGSIEELMARLRVEPKEGLPRRVVDAMASNATSFFRDFHLFETLAKILLPDLIARRSDDRQLNFWCGAASTGQEPYSVLMLIAEYHSELLKWDLNYTATDLCSEVLARARTGCFSHLEVNRGLSPVFLAKHFVRTGAEWAFNPELRDRVDFRQMNLIDDWLPLPPQDIVFLRNVLSYFNDETKRVILGKVRGVLRPGGYLLLGGLESILNLDEGFERLTFGQTICYRAKTD